jgi:hypothetical protein
MANEVYKDDANLEGLWLMEEASGARADYTPNSNDLTDNNTVGSSADAQEGSRSADFEAANSEYLSITDGAQIGLGITGDMSVCFWHKPETIVNLDQYLAKYQTTGDNRCWKVREEATDGIAVLISSDGTSGGLTTATTPNGQLSVGTWVHVAFVYDGTDIRIYINGSLASNGANNPKAYTGGIADKPSNFQIGVQHAGTSYIDGLMDEVAVFSRALSALEVDGIYNNGILDPLVTVPPIGYNYKMRRSS